MIKILFFDENGKIVNSKDNAKTFIIREVKAGKLVRELSGLVSKE